VKRKGITVNAKKLMRDVSDILKDNFKPVRDDADVYDEHDGWEQEEEDGY